MIATHCCRPRDTDFSQGEPPPYTSHDPHFYGHWSLTFPLPSRSLLPFYSIYFTHPPTPYGQKLFYTHLFIQLSLLSQLCYTHIIFNSHIYYQIFIYYFTTTYYFNLLLTIHYQFIISLKGDFNKILFVPKPAFYIILIHILSYYIIWESGGLFSNALLKARPAGTPTSIRGSSPNGTTSHGCGMAIPR